MWEQIHSSYIVTCLEFDTMRADELISAGQWENEDLMSNEEITRSRARLLKASLSLTSTSTTNCRTTAHLRSLPTRYLIPERKIFSQGLPCNYHFLSPIKMKINTIINNKTKIMIIQLIKAVRLRKIKYYLIFIFEYVYCMTVEYFGQINNNQKNFS